MVDDFGAINMASRMSLRDYFAAKAMQGGLASQSQDKEYQSPDARTLAGWAYEVADAMLKAREARNA